MADTHIDERGPEVHAGAHGGRHPGPKEYIRIAIILAAITAAEVAVYYIEGFKDCLLYTSPSPRDGLLSRMPSSA